MKLENSKNEKEMSYLQKRCNKIYKEYLKMIDQELFNYMIQIDIDATIFLVYVFQFIQTMAKMYIEQRVSSW
jgi:hypothetical protein